MTSENKEAKSIEQRLILLDKKVEPIKNTIERFFCRLFGQCLLEVENNENRVRISRRN